MTVERAASHAGTSSVDGIDDRLNCFHALRHCERSDAIQNLSAQAVWIASSQGLLAMTVERAASHAGTSSVDGIDDCLKCFHALRHCERSDLSAEALAKAEAIPNLSAEVIWIASSQGLLAMTVEHEQGASYDSRMSSSRRPSPFSSFFTVLDATTSPSLA